MRLPFRLVPGWKTIVLVAAPITAAAALLVAAYAYTASATAATPPATTPAPKLELPAQPGLLVDVAGAVEKPGLYRLPRGDRVFDAIAAAGGFSADADMSRVPNLAGRLTDGEQVKVPFAKSSSGTVIVRVNLNQATLDELEAVPGFSVPFAQECIDYRTNFGGFQNARELVDILGLSEAAYVVARRYLTL